MSERGKRRRKKKGKKVEKKDLKVNKRRRNIN